MSNKELFDKYSHGIFGGDLVLSENSFNYIMKDLDWVDIIDGDYSTYPKEGINVLVSDGINSDVAWFLMGSEYIWVKNDLLNDDLNNFLSFTVKKWKKIN